MVTAFLFPGQGSQRPGMADALLKASPAVREFFTACSARLGWDLESLVRDGPRERLDRTDISQPAILAVSLAAWMVRRPAEAAPAAAAGLSLGEYAALAAAGAIDPADAVSLVARRGELMQEACERHPGAMASVLGLDDGTVTRLIAGTPGAGVLAAANYNCPGQVVVSGSRERVAALEAGVSAAGGRFMALRVAGAFHSDLMRPAVAPFMEVLARAAFRAPAFPVYANVTAAPHGGPDEIRRLLAEQLVSPVRWTETIRAMAGIERLVELGPGTVLRGLVKKISPGVAVESFCG